MEDKSARLIDVTLSSCLDYAKLIVRKDIEKGNNSFFLSDG
ncbi:MAG: hypothetical protein AABY22_24630 [Nanoarchaeota archaeon]